MNKPLRKRSVTTLILLPSFLFALLSGVMLFIWPKGQGFGKNFNVLGGDHHFWEELHIMASILMVAAVAFHLMNNWKTLVHHTIEEKGTAQKPHISKEMMIGLLFAGVILAAAIWNFFPETAIMDLRHLIRNLWRS